MINRTKIVQNSIFLFALLGLAIFLPTAQAQELTTFDFPDKPANTVPQGWTSNLRSGGTPNPEVWMPDAALRAAVTAELNLLDPPLALTQRNLQVLSGIFAGYTRGNPIINLKGLEYATNLIWLDLNYNDVSNLSPISGLTSLTSLNLTDNEVSNISLLSGLTNLRDLDLWSNGISDISALSGLTSLTHLTLGSNSISDISHLSRMTILENLFLDENNISDISALSGLTSLTTLSLGGNSISDISALSDMTSLIYLNFRANDIDDISALSEITSLKYVFIYENDISDISDLSGNTSLVTLELHGNSVTNLSVLQHFTVLRQLGLGNNGISDISQLSSLENLDSLDLWANQINDITVLQDLTGLDHIDITGNPIWDTAANRAALAALQSNALSTYVSDFVALVGVTLTVPSTPQNGVFQVLVVFDEKVSDFQQSDLMLDPSATASITSFIKDGTTYTAMVMPTSSGNITFSIDVNVATGTAQNNPNDAAAPQTVSIDIDAPEVTLTVPSTPQNGVFQVSAVFNEEVLGFQQSNLMLDPTTIASITSFIEDDATYTATITPTSSGNITFSVPSGSATDSASNPNDAVTSPSVIIDLDPPEVSVSVPSNAQTGAFDVSVVFTEAVLDFEKDELIIRGSATVTSTPFIITDNTTYTTTIIPTTSGTVTFNVNAGVATDAANNLNTDETEITTVSVSLGTIVEIPDANLAGALRDTLSLAADASIYKSQLQSLTAFTYRGDQRTGPEHILNLTGMECATNLQELNLRGNAIRDTTPLTDLTNLTTLTLSGNNINSINVIKGLTNLEQLYLTSNHISNISGLEDLTALTALHIKNNPILDTDANRQTRSILQARSGLTLKIAAFRTDRESPSVEISVPTGTQNAAFRATITFTELVYGFGIDDLKLDGLSATVSSLVPNPQDMMSYFATITPTDTSFGYITLDINQGVVTDAADNGNDAAARQTVYTDLPPQVSINVPLGVQYGTFDVSVVFTETVSEFLKEELVIRGSTTVSSTPFTITGNTTYTTTITSTTSGTVTFDVDAGVATDVSDFENTAAERQSVTVKVDSVINIPDANLASALRSELGLAANDSIYKSHMESLTAFEVAQPVNSSNRIVDLTGLEHATNLTELTIRSHRISSVTVLRSLINLTELNLRGNKISDITALANLTSLTELNLKNNEITDVNALSSLTALTRLFISGNSILDTSPLYPLTQNNLRRVDITVSEYPPWDVNEDGSVDATDSALVTNAIGQSGIAILNPRTDVDGDGDVDADDLLLVTDNIDGTGAAPLVTENIVNLLDTAALEALDRDVLRAQLEILRANSDGSAKYLRAIAMLENILAASRPKETTLLVNYPNPFNPETWIPYHLAHASNVRITIYDVSGTVVRQLDLGHQKEGYYTNRSRAAYWDGRNDLGERVASGIYFYQLEADNVSLLRKMVILK